jgi:hypothetical protein
MRSVNLSMERKPMMADPASPLTPTEVARLLQAAAAEIRTELLALPDAAARWHPAPGEWCVLEAVGHLIEADRRAFGGRIRSILEQPGRRLEIHHRPRLRRVVRAASFRRTRRA